MDINWQTHVSWGCFEGFTKGFVVGLHAMYVCKYVCWCVRHEMGFLCCHVSACNKVMFILLLVLACVIKVDYDWFKGCTYI